MKTKLTKSDFLEKSKFTHGDKYDYSLVEYVKGSVKVKIICKEHGIFTQTPYNHMRFGCRFCSAKLNSIKSANKKRLTTEIFIERSNIVHDNRYDYSMVKYVDYETKVKIRCKEHGIFLQTPHHHLAGINCPQCSFNKKLTTSSFIDKAKLIHGDKYNYNKTIYAHCKEKVKIICDIHGIFEQTPTDHLIGCGCPICNESKGEIKIRLFLKKNNIQFKSQFKFEDCKYINKLSFDFYLQEFNMCIEFDGEQHFKKYYFEKDNTGLNIRKLRDKIKNEYCKNKNIRLMRIKYNEDVNFILENYLPQLSK